MKARWISVGLLIAVACLHWGLIFRHRWYRDRQKRPQRAQRSPNVSVPTIDRGPQQPAQTIITARVSPSPSGWEPVDAWKITVRHHEGCLRYVKPHGVSFGLGHQFASILLAQQAAERHGAVLRLDTAHRKWSHHAAHGYQWLEDFFDMSDLIITEDEVEKLKSVRVKRLSALAAVLNNSACNILATVHSGNSDFCDGWCFAKSPPWRVSPFLEFRYFWRQRHEQSKSFAQDVFDRVERRGGKLTLRVAWHVRNGDIFLHAADGYFKAIHKTLTLVVDPYKITLNHTVHAEKHEMPPFFRSIQAARASQEDPFTAIVAFSNAHVLVSCGSSFTHIAAIGADRAQIYIQGPPERGKKGEKSVDFYLMSETVVDEYGTMTSQAERVLRTQLRLLLQRYLDPFGI